MKNNENFYKSLTKTSSRKKIGSPSANLELFQTCRKPGFLIKKRYTHEKERVLILHAIKQHKKAITMDALQLHRKLDKTHSQLSKTIKKRSFYVEEKGLKIRIRHRSLEEIVSKYTNEVNEELDGFYRTHRFEYKDEDPRKYWLDKLMQDDYSFLFSIKFPHISQSGFRRTKNRKNAKDSYRILVKEIIQSVINRINHWERNSLQFIGVLEHGDSWFWHVHMLIKQTNNDEYIGYKLCEAISDITKKYQFYNTVFDLRAVYDKKGICAYMVKELTNKIEDEDGHVNEGSELFTMKTWFGAKQMDNFVVDYFKMNINYLDIHQLLYIIPFAALLKHQGKLFYPNPINKLKKRSAHNIGYRRKSKIQPTTNFDLFGRPFILFDTV